VKRLLSVLVLSLVVVQLFLMPALVSAGTVYRCPAVTTLPATNVEIDSATLNASYSFLLSGRNDAGNLILVSNVAPCVLYFQYGTQPGVYTSKTPSMSISAESGSVKTNLTGLNPCTIYYVRAVLSCPQNLDYDKGPADYLTALLPTGLRGLGVGIGNLQTCPYVAIGDEISFTTAGCHVGPVGQGTSGTGTGTTPSWPKPVQMSNIVVQSATIATPKVSPGQQVDITASVANNGGSNGDARVTLYVNGQEVESKGITVSSGQTTPVHFTVSRNEPGTYSVYVSGVSAGSFTVDLFTNNDILIYGLIALVTLGIAGTLYLVTRKRSA